MGTREHVTRGRGDPEICREQRADGRRVAEAHFIEASSTWLWFAFGASDAECDAKRGIAGRRRPCDPLRGFSSTMPPVALRRSASSDPCLQEGLLSTARSLGHTFGQSASSRGRSACIPASTACAVRSNLYEVSTPVTASDMILLNLRQLPNVTDRPCTCQVSLL